MNKLIYISRDPIKLFSSIFEKLTGISIKKGKNLQNYQVKKNPATKDQ